MAGPTPRRSASMVSLPFRLIFDRAMGTHSGRLGSYSWVRGSLNPGPCSPNIVWFAWVRMMQRAWTLLQAGALQQVGALQRARALQQAGALQQAEALQWPGALQGFWNL